MSSSQKQILTESIETTLNRFYSILRQSDIIEMCKLIAAPFNQWPHYQLGLIDDKGKILRMPKDSREKVLMQPFLIMLLDMKKNLYPVFKNAEYGSYLRSLGRVELRDKRVFENLDTGSIGTTQPSPANWTTIDCPPLDKVKKYKISQDLFRKIDGDEIIEMSEFPESIQNELMLESRPDEYIYLFEEETNNIKKIKRRNIKNAKD